MKNVKGMIKDILTKENLSKEDIVFLLNSTGEDSIALFKKSAEIREKYVGNKVYLRGLIEFSNICSKNCLYCGIRKDNKKVKRYNISDEEIIDAARFAYENNYGSLVLQSGELQGNAFTKRVETLLKKIKKISDNKLGITLSCGEQTEEVFQKWFEAGAHRYLLRIEASNKELYKKLHPDNGLHNWDERYESLNILKKTGYQTGTGVMIGLPFQTVEHLAEDLLFMQESDIDMFGMGPYIEHEETPLYQYKEKLLSLEKRFELTMKMIAVLRLMMKDVNIAATTALQAIDKKGREKIIKLGANVLMPNITPGKYRDDYALYQNKPITDEKAEDYKNFIEAGIKTAGCTIGYGEWGDSLHFLNRKKLDNV